MEVIGEISIVFVVILLDLIGDGKDGSCEVVWFWRGESSEW